VDQFLREALEKPRERLSGKIPPYKHSPSQQGARFYCLLHGSRSSFGA
jgi:hypothetical protein